MKASYVIIILVLIIIGAVLFFNGSDQNGSADPQNQSEQTDSTNDTTNDMDMNEDESDVVEDTPTEDMDETTTDQDLESTASDKGGPETMTSAKTFSLDGFNFGYSTEEIRVQKGDTVTINLTSTDGFHDWVVDEFGAATERVNEGESTSVTFVADEVGTFEYYCSVGNHRQAGMVGALIVE